MNKIKDFLTKEISADKFRLQLCVFLTLFFPLAALFLYNCNMLNEKDDVSIYLFGTSFILFMSWSNYFINKKVKK